MDEAQKILDQSVEACNRWKEVYERIANGMRVSQKPWEFDVACLFSNVDAFIQRCTDLQDICQSQLQFAPSEPIPVFGGLKGPRVKNNLKSTYVTSSLLISFVIFESN